MLETIGTYILFCAFLFGVAVFGFFAFGDFAPDQRQAGMLGLIAVFFLFALFVRGEK